MNMRLALVIAALLAAPASASDVAMIRVVSCAGPDAAMEVYLPEGALHGTALSPRTVTGAYALDLSAALKGKHLEPVHVSLSPDRKFLIVDQYTRGLPATRVPLAGGTVDFDRRFGTHAKCAPVGTQ